MAALLSACATTSPQKVQLTLDEGHREPDLVIQEHVVEPGQNLYRIAKAYGLDPEDLAAANGIADPRALAVGQRLLIPGADGPRAVAAAEPVESAPAPRKVVPKAPALTRTPGSPAGTLEWPVRGVLYGRFGKKGSEPHDGIDLAAPAGTPVKAAAAGTVLFAGEQKGYGQLAILEHANGLITLYAHNRDLRVKVGQKVVAGQVVATVGESGATSGPHLHFEVRRNGTPVDPMGELKPSK